MSRRDSLCHDNLLRDEDPKADQLGPSRFKYHRFSIGNDKKLFNKASFVQEMYPS